MRPQGTALQLEKRRRKAIRLLKAGKNLSVVARALSASVSSVFRWGHQYKRRGAKGLKPRPTPGRPPRLSKSQKSTLGKVLLKGPPAVGYRTDLWTLQRVAEVIDEHFDVQYHPSHVWKLLRDLGWSCQMPVRRALRRDEEAIAQWRRSRWYHIKNADRLGAHLVSVDESGFLLTPNITRTWAPKGHTPLLLYMYKQHRISAVSALVVSPKRRRGALYLAFRARNLTGLDTRAFLGDLLRHLRGPVVLLCDRGTILVRKEVTRYIAHHPRLHVEFFPAHAPELNPAEYVWNQTDRSLLNAAPEDIPEPYGMLHKSVRKLRRSQKLLWSCILCIRFALYKVSLSITYAKLNKKDHDLKSI